MSTKQKIKEWAQKISFSHTIKLFATLLIFVILLGFIAGVIRTLIDLRSLIYPSQPIDIGLKEMLVNVLELVAVIEILKTVISYLEDGRVRVTYIVDTILIVMLDETISFWFKGDYSGYLPLIVILLTLITIRVLAIRFSPNKELD